MPNFKAITKLDKIKKALRESPMREYEMPVTQEWQDGYGSIQTIYPTVKAINPEEAAIKMQQKYGKKNWDYDVAGIGNKKYDTEYISPSKAVEFQGPGKPVTEAEYQRLLQKGKAPELYQLDDGRSNWAYATEKDVRENPSKYWNKMDFNSSSEPNMGVVKEDTQIYPGYEKYGRLTPEQLEIIKRNIGWKPNYEEQSKEIDDYKKSLDEAWKNGDIWWMKK